jgi:hypothetical protein
MDHSLPPFALNRLVRREPWLRISPNPVSGSKSHSYPSHILLILSYSVPFGSIMSPFRHKLALIFGKLY